jgi:hypothetical protein
LQQPTARPIPQLVPRRVGIVRQLLFPDSTMNTIAFVLLFLGFEA